MSENRMIPTFTQIPNVALDLILPFLTEAEARVFLYILRRTYGFNKACEFDEISLSQFTDGIGSGESRKDFGTGLSRKPVVGALAMLTACGLVEKVSHGVGRGHRDAYRLNVKAQIVDELHHLSQEVDNAEQKMVDLLHYFRNGGLTPPIRRIKGRLTPPEMVDLLHPQKKEKESIKDLKRNQTILQSSADSASDAPPPRKRPKRIADSQQPGEIHETLRAAILALHTEAFHMLANENKLNERFWNAQITLIDSLGLLSIYEILRLVDAYFASHPEKTPLTQRAARAAMAFSIKLELRSAQRKGTNGRY